MTELHSYTPGRTYTICVSGRPIELAKEKIRHLPDTSGRIAIDQDGGFYDRLYTKKEWHQVRHGIYTLWRRLHFHIGRSYDKERPRLGDALWLCEGNAIPYGIDGLTEDDLLKVYTLTRQRQAELRETIGDRVKDSNKVQALKSPMLAIPIIDEDGSKTISMMVCQNPKARQHLMKRRETIHKIVPRISFHAAKIDELRLILEWHLEAAYTRARQAYRALANRQYEQAFNDLRVVSAHVRHLSVKPFRRTSLRQLPELEQARDALRESKTTEAMALVAKMGSSLELKRIRCEAELLVLKFTQFVHDPHSCDDRFFDTLAHEIHELARRVEVIKDDDFEQPVTQDVYRLLDEMVYALRFFITPELSNDSEKKGRVRLKEQFKGAIGIL